MKDKTVSTYRVYIHMAGDISQAKQCCRRYCFLKGLCVTIESQDFIYTGGEETGFRIGLLNYPRFPTIPDELFAKAQELAEMLLEALCQHSYLLEASDRTLWVTRRDECAAAKG